MLSDTFTVGTFIGSAGLLLGIGYGFRTGRHSHHRHPLLKFTEPTQAAIASLNGDTAEPYSGGASNTMPCRDVIAMYVNSRGNRRLANEARVDDWSPDREMLLKRIAEDHARIKGLAIATLIERGASKLNPERKPLYTAKAMWVYAEEQALLSSLAEDCAPQLQRKMLARIN